MNKAQIQDLVIKVLSSNAGDKEKEKVSQWISESESNKKLYREMEALWMQTAADKIPQVPDTNQEWLNLAQQIQAFNERSVSNQSILETLVERFQDIFIPQIKPLVIGLIIVILGISGVLLLKLGTTNPELKSIATSNNDRRNIQLSDGSTVYLNNGSTLEYMYPFTGPVRGVKLSGEAFFSVSKDARPFVITTTNATITVLGTKFNVWTRGEETKVFVQEGQVSLSQNQNAEIKSITLSKNQLGTVERDMEPIAQKDIYSQEMLGWLQGKLVFHRTRLNEIVDELGRTFNVHVMLASDSLKSYSLTGSFQNNDVDSVLSMICLALDLNFEKVQGNYVIRSNHRAQKE